MPTSTLSTYPSSPGMPAPSTGSVRIEPVQISGRRFHVVGHEAWGRDRSTTRRAAQE